MILGLTLMSGCKSSGSEQQSITKTPGTNFGKLVWSDEFDYTGLPDTTKWAYNVGNGCPDLCGWGNNELQYYTKDSLKNARVEDGKLIIEVHKEQIGNNKFSSAKLVTKGKQDWKYGRFEIRAKVPVNKGAWSAIWMLPTDSPYGGWPDGGEIDIMEHVGYDPDTVEASGHTKSYYFTIGTQKHKRLAVPDCDERFHTYALEWEEDEFRIFMDNHLYFTFANEGTGYKEWPFDQQFYLILNLAYGGNWGGAHGLDLDGLPQRLEIEYVRVYQKEDKSKIQES